MISKLWSGSKYVISTFCQKNFPYHWGKFLILKFWFGLEYMILTSLDEKLWIIMIWSGRDIFIMARKKHFEVHIWSKIYDSDTFVREIGTMAWKRILTSKKRWPFSFLRERKKTMAEKKKYGDIEFNDQQMEEFRWLWTKSLWSQLVAMK